MTPAERIAARCGQTDVHQCEHVQCRCFWCRVSRREPFETLRETQTLNGPKETA